MDINLYKNRLITGKEKFSSNMKRLCINKKVNFIPQFDANYIIYKGNKFCSLDELTKTLTPVMEGKGKAEFYVLPNNNKDYFGINRILPCIIFVSIKEYFLQNDFKDFKYEIYKMDMEEKFIIFPINDEGFIV